MVKDWLKKGKKPGTSKEDGLQKRRHFIKRPKKINTEREDVRFNRAAYDPRFREDEEQVSSVNLLDERFNKVFDDSAFNDDYEVDEYGRPISRNSAEFLAKYYKLSKKEIKDKAAKRLNDLQEYGEDLEGNVEVKEEELEEDEEDEGNEDAEDEDEEGEDDEVFSEEEDDDESSDEGEELEDAMKRFLKDADEDEEVATVEDDEAVTSRLAIQNMDWSAITSVDLLAVLHHFAPPGGIVKKVTIYPSDLGKEAMAREALQGPEGIWKDTRNEEVKKGYQGFDEHNLRRYEKNVLRYYYAVAECDSKKTAAYIYENCDGMEFEDSVNTLDLRYVPDGHKFTNEPRDLATRIPDNYTAPAVFTKALGHSQQELSWDRADPKRTAILNTDYSRSQLKEMSYETFVGVINDDEESDADSEVDEEVAGEGEEGQDGEGVDEEEAGSSEDGEEGSSKQNGGNTKTNGNEIGNSKNTKQLPVKASDTTAKKKLDPEERKRQKAERARSKYMGLLGGLYDKQPQKDELRITFDSNLENLASISDDEDESMEKEITFVPGMEDKAKQIMREKEIKAMPVWDQYLLKKAEKQKEVLTAKKEKAKAAMEERKQAFKEKPKKATTETEQDKRTKAELELLLAGDKEVETGFNMRQLTAEEKNKQKKKKKDTKEDKRQQDFDLNLNDPRFGAVYTNKEFAIDRSNPEYKATASMKQLEKETINRRYDVTGAPKKDFAKKDTQADPDWDSSRVASLKRKVDSFPSLKQKQMKTM